MYCKTIFTTILVALLAALLLPLSGCESNPLRFAPKEEQRATAALTHELARKVNDDGTVPGSPAAKKLVQGTRAATIYMGQPKMPPSPEDFETLAHKAEEQAGERPDAWELADSALELGIGISALFGGVYGIKAVQFLKQARQKSKALEEVVKGNELFKQAIARTDKALAIESFKAAQRKAQKSPETGIIVAQLK